jgi:hypothetical protein
MRCKLPYYTPVNIGATRDFMVPMLGDMRARFTVLNLIDRTYQIRSGSGSACSRHSTSRGGHYTRALSGRSPFSKLRPRPHKRIIT